jgi:S1-C subfamily serine protease
MPDQLRQCYLTTSLDAGKAPVNSFLVKYVKWASALVSLLVAIGGGVAIFRSGVDSVSPVGGARNRYEAAQRSAVLLIAPNGGQGTGIPMLRGDRTFVWTANHVVEGATKIKVRTVIRHNYHRVGYTDFTGAVIATNATLDVALLFVDAPAKYFRHVEFDSPVPPSVGSALYHIGNFLGEDFDNSVSTGILSQHGVKPLGNGWNWAITDQMTTAVVPGSSGGPVFNAANDKVAGVVVGHIPGLQMYFYVPVRAIEVWADGAGLDWAVRGDYSPRVLPSLPKPQPVPAAVLRIFSVN